jgi:hypothetical protein
MSPTSNNINMSNYKPHSPHSIPLKPISEEAYDIIIDQNVDQNVSNDSTNIDMNNNNEIQVEDYDEKAKSIYENVGIQNSFLNTLDMADVHDGIDARRKNEIYGEYGGNCDDGFGVNEGSSTPGNDYIQGNNDSKLDRNTAVGAGYNDVYSGNSTGDVYKSGGENSDMGGGSWDGNGDMEDINMSPGPVDTPQTSLINASSLPDVYAQGNGNMNSLNDRIIDNINGDTKENTHNHLSQINSDSSTPTDLNITSISSTEDSTQSSVRSIRGGKALIGASPFDTYAPENSMFNTNTSVFEGEALKNPVNITVILLY